MELGDAGRRRALFLRDTAQSQLESACNSQAVDYQLAEAALVHFHGVIFSARQIMIIHRFWPFSSRLATLCTVLNAQTHPYNS